MGPSLPRPLSTRHISVLIVSYSGAPSSRFSRFPSRSLTLNRKSLSHLYPHTHLIHSKLCLDLWPSFVRGVMVANELLHGSFQGKLHMCLIPPRFWKCFSNAGISRHQGKWARPRGRLAFEESSNTTPALAATFRSWV